MLLEKFEAFKADDTMFDLVAQQGVKILAPGFLVEFFVFDVSKETGILDDDFYVRHTGVGKILKASEFNASIDTHAEIKEKDIVLLGDHMSVMRLNSEWEDWFEQLQSPQGEKKPEPIKYTKGFHVMMSQGRLFYTRRGSNLIQGENLRFGEEEIKWYRGPYVMFVDPQDILYKIDNPFADVGGE
jgi:hypothetical protein